MGGYEIMTIFEWLKLFEDEDYGMILEEMADVFSTVDKYSDEAYKHQLDNPAVIDKVLDIMQGCYGKIEPVLALAETELINRELKKYGELRLEIMNEKGKISTVDEPAIKKEAQESVSDLRRVDNILKNYLMTCSSTISVCQSRLKFSDASKMNKEGYPMLLK
jgi:hypothetical protein